MTEAPTTGLTTLYRLRDADGKLLYVGISAKSGTRLEQHARSQPWWPDVASVTFEQHASRSEAADAERVAIRSESPRHNIAGNPAHRPDRSHRGRRYRVLTVRDFPKDLRMRIKVAAAEHGRTMRDFMIEAVEAEVERLRHEREERS